MCAVYVDDMMAPYKPGHRSNVTYKLSHMIADTLEELHAMADRIGVARRWFQDVGSGPHYDITITKRKAAVAFGAVEITWKQCGAMSRRRRVTGALGKPEDAIDWLRNYHQQRRQQNLN